MAVTGLTPGETTAEHAALVSQPWELQQLS